MARRTIILIGERPLVEEYSRLAERPEWIVLNLLRKKPTQKDPGAPRRNGSTKTSRIPRSASLALELTVIDREVKKENIQALDRRLPPSVPLLSSSVTVSLAEQQSWVMHPGRVIGIGALPTFLEGSVVEVATTPVTEAVTTRAATDFFRSLGKDVALVGDSVGMVLPRIVCMLANEACFALRDNVASRSDIDTAMKLGTNYPFGPFEWMERIGIRYVHAVVRSLAEYTGEERYRVAPLLHQAAALGSLPA